MKIIYSATYKAGATTHFAIHHAGAIGADVYSSSIHLTAENISKAHKDRWNFPSEVMKQVESASAFGTPWYGGYNFYIEKSGRVVQFRAVGEETAAQFGFNMGGTVISICFAGNHTLKNGKIIDAVTPEQITAYKDLICSLPRVPVANIVPHRHFGKTECYGNAFDSEWAGILAAHALLERAQAELNSFTLNSCNMAKYSTMAGFAGGVEENKQCLDIARG